MQRDGINIFCFITLHEMCNIQQSLPQERRGWEGDKHNQKEKRRLLSSHLGRDLKTEKHRLTIHPYPDRLRPWARSIGLQSTALSHLCTYAHTRSQKVGYGLVYGNVCPFPVTGQPLAAQEPAWLAGWRVQEVAELSGCRLSDWRAGNS